MESPKEKTTKPYSVRVTDNALQNIDDITGYIAYINHQPLNAIRVGDAIYDTIDRIEKNPLKITTILKLFHFLYENHPHCGYIILG